MEIRRFDMDNQVILREIQDALKWNNQIENKKLSVLEIESKKLSVLEDIASILTKIGVILENRNLMKD